MIPIEPSNHRPAVPVLTYHSNNVTDNSYSGNDHIALAEDLRALSRAGFQFISLDTLAGWLQGRLPDSSVQRSIALTFDDGSDFDFHDIDHPSCGTQRSFFNILRDHQSKESVPVFAATFVIASPAARKVLDEKCLIGRGWWNDDWWSEAQNSGLMSIQCHSWDHLHPVLDEVAQIDGLAGDFTRVASWDDCVQQVESATRFIRKQAGPSSARFFAYPWGQYSDFLLHEYWDSSGADHGCVAAFDTRGESVRFGQERWCLPRWVCGEHWQSSEGLLRLIEAGVPVSR